VLTAGDGLSGGGDLSADRSFAVDATVVRTTRTVSAGAGLSGGGDLSNNRTISLATTGPGASTIGGAGTYLVSVTIDAYGRITAADRRSQCSIMAT
jgi:hypothetical protein